MPNEDFVSLVDNGRQVLAHIQDSRAYPLAKLRMVTAQWLLG
jgi:hypothetical protein